MRLDYFYIISAHGRRNHHHVRAVDIFRLVAFENAGAKLAQALGDRRLLQIGAGNRVAAGEQDFGDAGHPAAADAD